MKYFHCFDFSNCLARFILQLYYFYFCRFRLVSLRSYIVTLNKFYIHTMLNRHIIITPLRTYLHGQKSFWMEVICLQHLLIWIFRKIQIFEFCLLEFHFCRHEINYTTFVSAFFCWREIVWVTKTETITCNKSEWLTR